ncbi:MAG: division/cell wall cluster transcriptional repressor MraZ [Chloroflexota bacterium]
MFLGQYARTIDEKSRMALPPEFRSGLKTGAVLTRSLDNCLCIYPAAWWETLVHAVSDLPDIRIEVRTLVRSLFGCAIACDMDRQGRIVIPGFLSEDAGLCGEAMVVGANNRIEIWNKEAWSREQEHFKGEGARLAETFAVPRV